MSDFLNSYQFHELVFDGISRLHIVIPSGERCGRQLLLSLRCLFICGSHGIIQLYDLNASLHLINYSQFTIYFIYHKSFLARLNSTFAFRGCT